MYDVLYKLTEHANETALGYMLNDLEAFNLPVYLDKTQVLILAAVATRSRWVGLRSAI